MGLLIREALEVELPQIITLLKELDQEVHLSIEDAMAIWQRMKQYPYYKLYVATAESEIRGTFCLLICDNLGHGGLRFAIVENVVVSPDYRRQGIGEKMILKAMALAKQNKCCKVMLSSGKSRAQAHEFYLQMGFEQHGISFIIGLLESDKNKKMILLQKSVVTRMVV